MACLSRYAPAQRRWSSLPRLPVGKLGNRLGQVGAGGKKQPRRDRDWRRRAAVGHLVASRYLEGLGYRSSRNRCRGSLPLREGDRG